MIEYVQMAHTAGFIRGFAVGLFFGGAVGACLTRFLF